MNPLFISFVIPVFNVEKYLPECLESVFSQKFRDWEIILVDDKSSDGSGQLCDTYAARHDRVRAVHMPVNGGPGSARNEGLRHASGEYVFFMDGDDAIGAGELAGLWETVSRLGYPDIMKVGFLELLGRAVIARSGQNHNAKGDICTVEEFLTPILLGNRRVGFRTWEFLFKKSTLKNACIEFGPTHVWEDCDFMVRSLFAAGSIGEYGGEFYHWRIRQDGSLTAAHDKMWPHMVGSAVRMLELACNETTPVLQKEWALRCVFSCLVEFETIAGAVPFEDIRANSDLFLPFSYHLQELSEFISEGNLLWNIRNSGVRRGVLSYHHQKAGEVAGLLEGRGGRDVYVMPATRNCARLCGVLEQNGYPVKGMLDNDIQKQGLEFFGNAILSPDLLPLSYEDYGKLFILVSTSTKKTAAILADQLRGYGLEEEKHFECSWFDGWKTRTVREGSVTHKAGGKSLVRCVYEA